ncbi:MAG: type IX secretion system sortase PorU [Bacteroidetes bacterium]|nr:type IX secretion system sortase PorU [Bacteroidota bacterium]
MKHKSLIFFLLLCLYSRAGTPHKTVSVLATGKWFRIAIHATGIHKISYADFVSMGIDFTQVNDSAIRIFGNGSGMLPETNISQRVDDLREVCIRVVDGGDGKMNPGDYVLFYGEGPDKWSLDKTTYHYIHSKNLYSDSVYYYINMDTGKGKRVPVQNSADTIPNYYSVRFDDHVFHEIDQENLIKSGKSWFGEVFNETSDSYDFTYDFPYIDSISPIRIVTNVAAQSIIDSWFFLYVNNHLLDSIKVPFANYPDDPEDFARIAQKVSRIYNPHTPFTLNLIYQLPDPSAKGWLDNIEFNLSRNLHWAGPQMNFRDANSIGTGKITQFKMTGADPSVTIWDVTDPGNITEMKSHLSHDTMRFVIRTDSLKEFIAFDGSVYNTVHLAGQVDNQNLHALEPATLVIVTNPLFLQEANRLADFHRQHDKIPVVVAKTTEIYHEFSCGEQDPTAIRDFVKMLYDRGSGNADQPKYLLLFGDGSYDPKNRVPGNNNLIPTYQSLESVNTGFSYVTEDYYGIMGDFQGQNSNGTINLGIGRLPVSTLDQAIGLVDKIIHYTDVSDTILADWRNQISFIADDQEGNLFLQQTEQLTAVVENQYPVFNVEKIYLDAYPLISTPIGPRYPAVNEAITKAMEDGKLLINYVGHGGDDGLAEEKILSVSDIQNWNNQDKFPVFVVATCEFSHFDNPERLSAGEMVINKSNAGAIALFTTTRITAAPSNYPLDTSFFHNLVTPVGEPVRRMGDLIKISKNNNNNNPDIRNYVLLGDPALEMAFPENNVVTTQIGNLPVDSIADTVRGLSIINVKGEVRNPQGDKLSGFDGILFPRIFDKPTIYSTIGNKTGVQGSYPQPFHLQDNLLSSLKISVTHGEFEFSFIVPKDIALQFGKGKISYYAQNGVTDANGYSNDIVIGGRDPTIDPINSGPIIRLFMNDTTFVPGGITSPDPVCLAYLKDPDGINYTGLGIGHEIIAWLDEDQAHPIVLNDYFKTDMNSYQSGSLKYPLENLSVGFHQFRLMAWDFYNNPSEAKVGFFVVDPNNMTVRGLLNFPNPFKDATTFRFYPVKLTGSMNVNIQVTSMAGIVLKTIQKNITGYESGAVDIIWDGTGDNGSKLGNGIYLYKLIVKGDNDSFMQTVRKLAILK